MSFAFSSRQPPCVTRTLKKKKKETLKERQKKRKIIVMILHQTTKQQMSLSGYQLAISSKNIAVRKSGVRRALFTLERLLVHLKAF